MNKLTKGTIAASAALLLLLGTGGTLAFWNDTANLDGATVTAGNLELAQTGTGTWTVQHTSGAVEAVDDIAAFRVVPGDKLTYMGDFVITAQGDNLVVQASVAPGAIAPAAAGDAEDEALASRLTQSATYTINGTAEATGTVVHRDAATGTYPVQIAVTIEWPFGDAASPTLDNPGKQGAVNLSAFAVTVTQLDGSTTP